MGLEEKSREQELKTFADLMHEATVSDLVDSVPPWLYKPPEQIARDYLRFIAEHVREELVTIVGRRVPENVPLNLVVSYPSVSLYRL